MILNFGKNRWQLPWECWILGKIFGRHGNVANNFSQSFLFKKRWKMFSQEWKCNGQPKKLHWWVATNLWKSLAPDFWPRECVKDMGMLFKTARLHQSDLSRPFITGSAALLLHQLGLDRSDWYRLGVLNNIPMSWTHSRGWKSGARLSQRLVATQH